MYINLSETLSSINDVHDKNRISQQPSSLYEPRNYIMAMAGKKMRSLLTCMSYGLYDTDIAQTLELAYSIELFHNFTLVHDDIMDDAALRRGVPSVHNKFGSSSAILSGDVMLIEVYERLLQLPDPVSYISSFNEVARRVCEGQALDMDFENRNDVTIAEYLHMIELKTAVLLGLCFSLGAKRAGASINDQERLYNFGVNAGIGFQIQDDYLDVYGDPDIFGKKPGGDIIQGKKTYLYLRAVELLDDKAKQEFIKIYQSKGLDHDDKVNRVRASFDALYMPNYCEEAKRAFFDLALSHMSEVDVAASKKEELIEFSRKLLNRDR